MRHHKYAWSVLVAVLLGFSRLEAAEKLKNVRIRGYVTNVTSPTHFDIEDYRITRDEGFTFDFDNASPELTFRPEDVRVGDESEIRGFLNEETGELHATSIKVDMEQFKKLRQTVILSQPPAGLEQSETGWSGTVLADDQRIRISPSTEILYGVTNREKKALNAQEKKRKSNPESEEEDLNFHPLRSLDEVTTGMMMTYEGMRNHQDGTILAERVEFRHNDLEDGEAKLWKSLNPKIKPSQEQQLKPGELAIPRVGKFKLLPSEEVQQYVSDLGRRLVPQYQQDMPETDPTRIPFRFYVVI